MIKYIFIGLCFLCILNISAYAEPVSKATGQHKQEMGLGIGALLGGLIGGPPGAIIGAAGGAWYGSRRDDNHMEMEILETRLQEKQSELEKLQAEFAGMKLSDGSNVQKVLHNDNNSDLEALSRGVSLNVYFRTGSDILDEEATECITQLASYLQGFPEIQIHLDAFTDIRGSINYNRTLSSHRAQAVTSELLRAGIEEERIHSHAYGETRAVAESGDLDGYALDRRVTIHLTLDAET